MFYRFGTNLSAWMFFYLFKQKINTLFILLLLVFTGVTNAQTLLGISGSNYAGINSVYNNPANLGDNRLSFALHLATFDAYISNDYLVYNAPFSLFSFITNATNAAYKSNKGRVIFKPEYLTFESNNDKANLHIDAQLRGPSVLFTINDKSTIALSSRLRVGGNMNNVDNKIIEILTYGTNRAGLRGPTESVNDITSNVNFYMDIAATYSKVLIEENEHFLKGGFALKYLSGYYANQIKINNASYSITADAPGSIRDNITAFSLDALFTNTVESSYKQFKLSPGWLLGEGALGKGVGFDFGVVYEHRKDIKKYSYREKGKRKLDPSKNKYDYKIGVSVLDIGSIRYNNPNTASQFPIKTQNKVLSYRDFGNIIGTDDLENRIESVMGTTTSEIKNSFVAVLPTNLHVNFDYKLHKNLYINTVWQQSLVKKSSLGTSTTSFLAIAPRYETNWFEASLPISYEKNLNIGTAVRLGPVFIGSDNIIALFGGGNKKTVDLYFGAYVPIFRKGPSLPNECWNDSKKSGFFKKLFHKK